VVIHNLHVFCARFRPPKTDAPPIIDSNAVLAGTVALKHFEAVAGRHPQVIQLIGDLNLSQLAPRHCRDVHKSPDADAFRKRFRIGALE